MSPDITTSHFLLWLSGLAWVFGPWLSIAFALTLAALGMQWLHRFARSIETKPVKQGFFSVYWDLIMHRSISQVVLFLTIGSVAFAGLLGAGIHGIVQKNVQEIVETELSPDPETLINSTQEVSLDMIFLMGLIMAVVTVIIGIRTYKSLCRRAVELASDRGAGDGHRPFIVKVFYDNKKVGVVIMIVGCWFLWGLLTQIGGGVLMLVPLPRALTTASIPGVTTVVIYLIIFLGVLLFIAFLGPFAWFSWRNLKLQIRYIKENRSHRRLFYIQMIVFGGFFGYFLNLYLLQLLGQLMWPSLFH
jgi:hypothetical protein